MLLVCRFAVPEDSVVRFTERASTALELLTAQVNCLGGVLGRSTDVADRWVLSVEFATVVDYRRALSPFEVREQVIPLLSEALVDEPATYEVLLDAAGGEVERRTSLVASDAFTVRLGEAAGPSTPRN